MFKHTKTFSSFSVKDLDKAKDFYRDILGFDVKKIDMGEGNFILEFEVANGGKIMAYPKPNHTPATFTILNFQVTDVEKAVDELTANGVEFQHYNNEWMNTDAKGILRDNGPVIAWFTDPAGNILSVVEDK